MDNKDSENVTVNHRVGGSNPSQGAISLNKNYIICDVTGITITGICAIESDLRYSKRVVLPSSSPEVLA